MTKERTRRILVGITVAIVGAWVVLRELIRSGTLEVGALSHWHVQAGMAAGTLAVAFTAVALFNRAYRTE